MPGDIFTQERGVSTVVGYILAISVTTVLLAGVVLSTTQFIQFQQTETAESQLDVVGEQIAFSAQKADTAVLNRTTNSTKTDTYYERSVPAPNRVAGKQYSIYYDDAAREGELVLETTDGRVERRVPLRLGGNTTVAVDNCPYSSQRITAGSELKVEYNNAEDCVVIKNG